MSAWTEFYGGEHPGTWTYGLPELLRADGTKQREALREATRIAVPGCNVTAVTLGLQPLLAAGFVDPTRLTAALANGVSGAGKALKPHLLAGEILSDVSSYGQAGTHRHVPEIEQNLAGVLGVDPGRQHDGAVRISSFTPTLVPVVRGIHATLPRLWCPVSPDEAAERAAGSRSAYADEPFVTALPQGRWPRTSSVTGSNTAQIQWALDARAGTVLVTVALDNLVRGTAGQALQSAHLALASTRRSPSP